MDATLYIAKIGKSVGLKGENRLITDTDFPEQFKKGSLFTTNKNTTLTVEKYNHQRGVVKFEGVNTPEDAKKITNQELYTTKEATAELCTLKKNEYYWYDIEGCEVYENGVHLGTVDSLDRISITDYLVLNTSSELVEKKLAKLFMIPYIDTFIVSTDIEAKKIEVTGAYDILEAS